MRQMFVPTAVMMGLAVAVCLFVYLRQPAELLLGIKNGMTLLVQTVPLLLSAFVIVGLMPVVIPKELVVKWIGVGSGWRGLFIGSAAGALGAGPPYAIFPIVAGLYKAGAGIGPVVACLTAWSVCQLGRIPMGIALLGPKVTVAWLSSVFFFPPVAGYIAHLLFGR